MELVRDLLPLQFFSGIALALAVLSIVLAVPVISTYLETGLVPRLPTAVLALGVMLLAFIAFFTGLILDSVAKGRREAKLLAFLKYPNAAQSKSFRQT